MSTTRDTGFLRNAVQVTNQGIVFVSGSTLLMSISSSGAVTTTGVISGSNALSASFSLNSALLNGTGSVGFATTGALLEVSSSQQQISSSLLQVSASYISLSGSYNTFSGSASTRITANSSSIQQVSSSQQQISASLLNVVANYATTGSNSFRANQSITGSLVVSSTITAQTLVVQTVTSSIVYSSGSNLFGSALGDRQTFTGSVNITGSLTVNTTGTEFQVTNLGVVMGNLLTDNHSVTGSIYQTGSIAAFAGSVGIGTTNPTRGLHLNADGANPVLLIQKAGSNLAFLGTGTSTPGAGNESSILQMYHSGSELIRLYTQGVSFISSSSVGIGTTNPVSLLHLQSGSLTIAKTAIGDSTEVGRIDFRNDYMGPYTWAQIKAINGSTHDFSNIVFSTTYGFNTLTERMRITSAGYVGIGHTSPACALDIGGTESTTIRAGSWAIMENVTTNQAMFGRNVTYNSIGGSGWRSINTGYATGIRMNDDFGDGSIVFYTNPSTTGGTSLTNWDTSGPKFIVRNGGNVGIGTTNPSYLLHIPQGNNLFLSNLYITGTASNPILSSGATGGSMYLQGGGAGEGNIYLQGAGSGGNGYIEFRTNGSLRMTISSGGNIGAPSGTNIYNASDARLKQNITTITNGLDKVMGLNPVKFNWINNFVESEEGKDMLGFVAQEVQTVIPEAVENFSGNSITVGETTVENPLRVNEKFIIPVLVKAIQELKLENDSLKEILQRNNIN